MIQYITDAGLAQMARVLEDGNRLTFTRAAVGSGAFSGTAAQARAMTGLLQRVAWLDVAQVRRETDGVSVVADLVSGDVPGGTAIGELGVYARAAGGDEFLFAYAWTDEPEVVPDSSESAYEKRFISHLALGEDELALVVAFDHLPVASTTVLGGVMVGSGLSATADGLLSAEVTSAALQQAIADAVSNVYKYQGSVSEFADLPEDAANGDVYNVAGAHGDVAAGTNWAWAEDAGEWDALAGTVDLSAYQKRATAVPYVMAASGWAGKNYSLEADFPSAEYDVQVLPTAGSYEAFAQAAPVGSASGNVVTAMGDVPGTDMAVTVMAAPRQ